jgi:non-ribosomal peptide synthetase component F
VGSPIANRQYQETEGLIGMFVNTLALRSYVEGRDEFSALLAQVKATCLEAYENQDAPFEKIVELLQPERNLAINPIFQVMVVMLLQNGMGMLDQNIQLYPVEMGVTKFDLTIGFQESMEELRGSIEHSTALYKGETIARMAEHFVGLCRAIVARPAARIQELEYVGQREKQRVLVEFNDTRVDYPRDKCIHDFFIEQVEQNGEKVAVVWGKEQLTYQQLYERSRDLAMYLQSVGVKPDSVVGLCMERSLAMMVGLFGILQAGGAYVPLDPGYPEERLAYMLRDSAAMLVVTQERMEETVRGWVCAWSDRWR